MAEDCSSDLQPYLDLGRQLCSECDRYNHLRGVRKLHKKCQAELNFLCGLKSVSDHQRTLHLRSSNLAHLRACVDAFKSLPHVTQVLSSFYIKDMKTSAVVDVVCNHGYTWVKVIARKPQALHHVWAGRGQFGERTIVEQAQKYVECAKENQINFTIPQVVFLFTAGVTPGLQEALQKCGISVQGAVVELPAETEPANGQPLPWNQDSTDLPSDLTLDAGESSEDEDEELITASDWLRKQRGAVGQEGCGLESTTDPEGLRETLALVGQGTNTHGNKARTNHTSSKGLLNSSELEDTGTKTDEQRVPQFISEPTPLPCFVNPGTTGGRETTGMGIAPPCTSSNITQDAAGMLFLQQPSIHRANLDVTTLICLASNLCHGRAHFVFEEKILSQQAFQERQCALLPKLQAFLEGKELFVCKTALQSFRNILECVGGPTEKLRAEEFLSDVHTVPDEPSEKALQLTHSARIKDRAKVIFGTGDSLEAVTVTANEGFVRAATSQKVSFSVFLHESRALTELKEVTAKPIVQS